MRRNPRMPYRLAVVVAAAALADDPLDELARLGRDVAPAVHDARDGRNGHAGEVRDLADRDPAAGAGP